MGMTHQWALLFSNGAKRLCLFQLIAPYIGAACVFCLLLCILYFCNIIVVLVKYLRMIYWSLKYRHRVHIVLPHACQKGLVLHYYFMHGLPTYLLDTLVNLTYCSTYIAEWCWSILALEQLVLCGGKNTYIYTQLGYPTCGGRTKGANSYASFPILPQVASLASSQLCLRLKW